MLEEKREKETQREKEGNKKQICAELKYLIVLGIHGIHILQDILAVNKCTTLQSNIWQSKPDLIIN